MEEFLNEFFSNCECEIFDPKSIIKTNSELDTYEKRLKQSLTKKQKKLLLKIKYEKDFIIESVHTQSFLNGFKVGLKVGYEVNRS